MSEIDALQSAEIGDREVVSVDNHLCEKLGKARHRPSARVSRKSESAVGTIHVQTDLETCHWYVLVQATRTPTVAVDFVPR